MLVDFPLANSDYHLTVKLLFSQNKIVFVVVVMCTSCPHFTVRLLFYQNKMADLSLSLSPETALFQCLLCSYGTVGVICLHEP